MSQLRNIDWLHRRRIVYTQYPTTDIPTEIFNWGWYYKHGTFQCYELFRSTAKINTIKSLKWHLVVLYYLNQDIGIDKYKELCYFLVKKENNFVSIDISISLLDTLIIDTFGMDTKMQPKNRLRKIIFKMGCGLEIHEKLAIVGSLTGREKKVSEHDIYQCMLDINEAGKKITARLLASTLNVSAKTIHRTMPTELREEKDLLNQSILTK
jgi:hypothetical protein